MFKSAMKLSATYSSASRMSPLTVCNKCRGEGRIRQRPSRKARLRHKRAKQQNDNNNTTTKLAPQWKPCADCQSTGLIEGEPPIAATPTHNTTSTSSTVDTTVAIVGGGIGGLALGVALKHRGIDFRIYERDVNFSQRSQGYGLTMQQASKCLASFGISPLKNGITSTKHVVHTTDGSVVGEWGMRKWVNTDVADNNNNKSNNSNKKRQNVHIARQSLRRQLLDALGGDSQVQWGCQLLDYKEEDDKVTLSIQQESTTFTTTARLLVGADGIRSAVRSIYIGEQVSPLRYLGCIVVLGICPRTAIQSESPLLDGETVFQTADGTTRLYAMPYSPTEVMWQLSFPLDEQEAKRVSREGSLKQEALQRCGTWHDPISQLLHATPLDLVSGYPVYDRALLTSDLLPSSKVMLLGDAAHPMSPFKGQGANQALLDSLSLARALYGNSDNQEDALRVYEEEMLARSSVKVKASAEAAQFLHSSIAIQKGDITRAAAAKESLQQNKSRKD